jgi:hypothetical protein
VGGDVMNDHWLVRPGTIRLLWMIFAVILVVTVMADMFIHHHAWFGLDGTFGLGAWFGFVSCIAMVAFAKALGAVLKRRDTYYDS